MKFKLFGRLRDQEENGSTTQTMQRQGNNTMQSAELSGGSLDRTVQQMFEQGYSEEEIRRELQGQYSEQEITKAINNNVAQTATNQEQFDQEMSMENKEPVEQKQQQPEMKQLEKPGGNQEEQTQKSRGPRNPVDPQVEELIETIVGENFEKVKLEFQNLYDELGLIEEEVGNLEERVHDLEVRDDEDQQQFVQKVDEVENHIDEYQSRIGGLEKAFQQVLPSLVDNVRDLTSTVQEMKQQKGINTETTVNQEEVEDVNEELEDW